MLMLSWHNIRIASSLCSSQICTAKCVSARSQRDVYTLREAQLVGAFAATFLNTSAPGHGGVASRRVVHAQVVQAVVQRLQREAEPVLAPGQQAAAECERRHAQPRRARVRIHQHRTLAQPPCTRNVLMKLHCAWVLKTLCEIRTSPGDKRLKSI